ncbi:MAG TPA: ATP synthase F1 subunit delta [Candidatus Limnocylindria bacterium]|jgi:F-type H+-transporting ATPase subunit delta|nr:ATP synthase F1 subunit delta [Candidatus Limnocylindria bacterium]
MALSGSAARRYAEALYQIAISEKAVDEFGSSLERLQQALSGEVLRALRNPGIALRARRAAIDAATAGEPKAIRSLFDLLLERERVALFPQIAAAYIDLVERRAGIVKGRITTATQLSANDREELVRRLERSSGKRIRATFAVDASLIGGARVQVGDRLIDSSLKAQLDELRRELAS